MRPLTLVASLTSIHNIPADNYVQTPEAIAATFGECIAGILSTRAYSIRICLRAQDGCRIVALATPYPTSELRSAKDYDVMLGSIYQGESKSVLLRLSLRNMSLLVHDFHRHFCSEIIYHLL
jgi:hypothetical protein